MLDLSKLKEMERRFDELEHSLCNPEVLNNPAEYQKLSKERKSIEDVAVRSRELGKVNEQITESHKALTDETDAEMRDLYRAEIDDLEKRRTELEDELTKLLLPRDPYAGRDVIVEIRPAAGGEESTLFAQELFRMYLYYAERKGWSTEILARQDTDLGGMKEVSFSIVGQDVYQHMKYESGVHRVQRVPVTESSGRIHTSTVTVAVLPEADSIDEVHIDPKDLRIDTYRSTGAGGQHINKTESAIRMTHLPTGIVVTCQDERSQRQNREKAMRVLQARLLEIERNKIENEMSSNRRSQVGQGDRSEKIRTYNFPQSRVTDHRIGFTVHNINAVMEGDLDDIVQALCENEQKELMEQLGQG
ncbi:MAG: peptide chain release factor 1 [bacterium]|nr:peptide chain release factor 1 [bacterium]